MDGVFSESERYVLADEAVNRMHEASVLILGLGGLGVEIAKNLILGGVSKVGLWDNQVAKWTDLAGNFYITEEDVKNGVPRVDACVAKLRELNPGVNVEVVSGDPLTAEHLEQIQTHFNCVIATEIPLSSRLVLNKHLRAHQIPFITGDAMGIFVGAFCDFGDEFLVHDPRPEEGRELLIGKITQATQGEVTCLEGYLHHLEVGDLVEFRDVRGMTELNGRLMVVEKIVSPLVFCIGDTSNFSPHEQAGLAKQAPKPKTMTFDSLEDSLRKPEILTCDLGRFNAANECHVAWLALMQFSARNFRLPRPNNAEDISETMGYATTVSRELKMEDLDRRFLENAFSAASGQLNPLVAALGGILAQEAMKALTGKWTPLHQWLYIDARDVYASDCTVNHDRYDGIRICVGDKTLEQLKSLNLFMVGCGAIGCEMLKNLALIGASCGPHGTLQITDDDNIEKSNLNRQFLFRPEHITKSKSEVGAERIRHINADVNVRPYMLRVSPVTQKGPFTDEFFQKQDIVINALDNVQARLYMDQRCVTNAKPLLDSGTLSTKGHVQVVVPYLTESYGTQRDPGENAGDSIPYCTLKQFPALMEHCIEWAREKFQSSFSQKPDSFNSFWQLNGPSAGQLLQTLQEKTQLEGIPLVQKLISHRPRNFTEIVFLARAKFEKYFNHKAQQLLTMFPEDHELEGGIKFWISPKRAPTALLFDVNNSLHMAFIRAACVLYGKIYGIPITAAELTGENLKNLVRAAPVLPFVAKGKETSVLSDAPPPRIMSSASEIKQLAHYLQSSMARGDCTSSDTMVMHPESFEKDDDTNAHVDFIYAAANLRAAMYRIQQFSRFDIKRIVGITVPAMTTTACVTGLACLELIKLAQDLDKMTPERKHLLDAKVLERYKNTFLNLALPAVIFLELGALSRVNLPGGLSVTLWDQWTIDGVVNSIIQITGVDVVGGSTMPNNRPADSGLSASDHDTSFTESLTYDSSTNSKAGTSDLSVADPEQRVTELRHKVAEILGVQVYDAEPEEDAGYAFSGHQYVICKNITWSEFERVQESIEQECKTIEFFDGTVVAAVDGMDPEHELVVEAVVDVFRDSGFSRRENLLKNVAQMEISLPHNVSQQPDASYRPPSRPMKGDPTVVIEVNSQLDTPSRYINGLLELRRKMERYLANGSSVFYFVGILFNMNVTDANRHNVHLLFGENGVLARLDIPIGPLTPGSMLNQLGTLRFRFTRVYDVQWVNVLEHLRAAVPHGQEEGSFSVNIRDIVTELYGTLDRQLP